MIKIALLGATSHVAKGLIYHFSKDNQLELSLYARSPERVKTFLHSIDADNDIAIKTITEFTNAQCDAIVNCIGIGDPSKLSGNSGALFALTESIDGLILDYLSKNPQCVYINFSSGAAYGHDFMQAAHERKLSCWNINSLKEADVYGIAKLCSEVKHRALMNFSIVDLRLFSYFSRFVDENSKFLMTEILSCIRQQRELVTNSEDIVRDYIHPRDLSGLIMSCIKKMKLNTAFDVYSGQPVTKFKILDFFSQHYDLRYRIEAGAAVASITGTKMNYYSLNKRAGQEVDYEPQFTSMEAIALEAAVLLRS